MNIKEILKRIDKKVPNIHFLVNYADLFLNIEADFDVLESDKLTSYSISEWYERSAGANLGWTAHFFENEPVAVSFTNASYHKESVKWISKELFLKVKSHIMSHIIEEDNIDILEDIDIDEYYIIYQYESTYKSQRENAYFGNELVKIVDYKKHPYYTTEVLIQFQNGATKWVNMRDLLFRINII